MDEITCRANVREMNLAPNRLEALLKAIMGKFYDTNACIPFHDKIVSFLQLFSICTV